MTARARQACECDGCGKVRRDVQACGRDGDGAPDAPCLCFICRKQGSGGRVYDRRRGTYVPHNMRGESRDEP